MSKSLGGVIGFFVGGFVVFMLFVIIVTAVAGPLSSAEMTAGGFIIVLFSPVAALLGAIMGAVTGVRIVSTEAKRGSSFERHGNGMRCNECGSELIGLGGPCRKCDDVQTRPCASCGRYILPNDKTCQYCGAVLK